eukprot:2241619-Pyramimonas_sp.AAC.1
MRIKVCRSSRNVARTVTGLFTTVPKLSTNLLRTSDLRCEPHGSDHGSNSPAFFKIKIKIENEDQGIPKQESLAEDVKGLRTWTVQF